MAAEAHVGRLTTHVLDTAAGRPAGEMTIELFRLDDAPRRLLEVTTNADGRCDSPLLEGDAFEAGVYELVFHAGDYFRGRGIQLPEPAFLDRIVIRFGIASPQEHYHVPLLVAPYGYGTYRGS